MPTVSVIMGIYNTESKLADSIESILQQTYSDWELIMCDDGSTDRTYEIAKKYSDKYENIYLLKNNKNMGLAYSLNKCLKYASGKYIARSDADDINLPNRFKVQVEFLEKNPQYQLVGCSAIIINEKGIRGIRKLNEVPDKKILITSVPFIHPTVMVRKEVYDILNGYTVTSRTRRGQDLDLWFRFFAKGFNGYNIPIPLYKYNESLNDYKKRNLKIRLSEITTRYFGYKLLGFPKYYNIFLLKPLLATVIPDKLIYRYHKYIENKRLN